MLIICVNSRNYVTGSVFQMLEKVLGYARKDLKQPRCLRTTFPAEPIIRWKLYARGAQTSLSGIGGSPS